MPAPLQNGKSAPRRAFVQNFDGGERRFPVMLPVQIEHGPRDALCLLPEIFVTIFL